MTGRRHFNSAAALYAILVTLPTTLCQLERSLPFYKGPLHRIEDAPSLSSSNYPSSSASSSAISSVLSSASSSTISSAPSSASSSTISSVPSSASSSTISSVPSASSTSASPLSTISPVSSASSASTSSLRGSSLTTSSSQLQSVSPSSSFSALISSSRARSTTSSVMSIVKPSFYTTAAACSASSASCPCAGGYACQSLSSCSWVCHIPTTFASIPTSRTFSFSYSPPRQSNTANSTSTTIITATFTVTPVKPTGFLNSTSTSTGPITTTFTTNHGGVGTAPPQPPPTNPIGQPPFASGNADRFLPCVPGTFICTSSTTWDTCEYSAIAGDPESNSTWSYGSQRYVSAGMECLPLFSAYDSETQLYAQQALTPKGYYRDDQIVAARPDGSCSVDGQIQCTDGGETFEVCNQGGWVPMGDVAQGTTCQNGKIVASRR